ncbi:histidine kinase [Clostridium sp. HMP27]|uniref:sensor histidine kinase n=1 Tax=Clostridium sp. HMP27 TaxID=1487921 RepID=UPI00052BAE15|nr:histidine kinase [Clostridium sp. HMP27]KGK85943.1 hypothetical protein DP68_15440 [Clostridium sp. HMP27]
MIHEKRIEQVKSAGNSFSIDRKKLWTSYGSKFVNKLNKIFSLNYIKSIGLRSEIDTIRYIMDLYLMVEEFKCNDSLKNIIEVFVDYTRMITRSSLSFFWLKSNIEEDIFMVNTEKHNLKLNLEIKSKMESLYANLKDMEILFEVKICNETYLISVVKSVSKIYGILGIKKDSFVNNSSAYEKQLKFLSELSTRTFERLRIERSLNHIMITEEQNRIANELHDTVSQELFSMVCGVHNVINNLDNMTEEEVKENLEFVKSTARYSLGELRNAIYKLSSKKKKEQSFRLEIGEYLNCLSNLNCVKTNLKIKGDEYTIPCYLKQALYRIVCEASGNAIRHGKCTILNIDLIIENDLIKVSIIDNGIGFNYIKLDTEKSLGLGIYNMQSLTKGLNGKFQINSKWDKGTAINIIIPKLYIISNDEEEVLL